MHFARSFAQRIISGLYTDSNRQNAFFDIDSPQKQIRGQIRTATTVGAFCERPRATAGRPYQIKIHLQSHRCKGILDRFELD